MNDSESGKGGRHANTAMRQAHREMDESEKPLVEIHRHMGNDDEYIIKIDHEQFGGPIAGDELERLAEEIGDL